MAQIWTFRRKEHSCIKEIHVLHQHTGHPFLSLQSPSIQFDFYISHQLGKKMMKNDVTKTN